jgi:pheromone a factor receptor
VTRLEVGMIIGIPASALCIYRGIYNILVLKTGAVTLAEKRRTVIIDLLIAAGLPVLAMGIGKCAQ